MSDDGSILKLLYDRDEQAVAAVSEKYGAYLMKIASNFLTDRSDREECVNDVYLRFWQEDAATPPEMLSVYLVSLTREICIDYYRKNHRKKRIPSEYTLSLSEISDLAADEDSQPEAQLERLWLTGVLNRYFRTRPKEVRTVFVMRYFYMDPVSEIAKKTGYSVSKINTMLSRERKRLKSCLGQEGIEG